MNRSALTVHIGVRLHHIAERRRANVQVLWVATPHGDHQPRLVQEGGLVDEPVALLQTAARELELAERIGRVRIDPRLGPRATRRSARDRPCASKLHIWERYGHARVGSRYSHGARLEEGELWPVGLEEDRQLAPQLLQVLLVPRPDRNLHVTICNVVRPTRGGGSA